LHLQEFITHFAHGPFQGRGFAGLVTILVILLLDKPSLDITHAFLERANVSNSPLFELLETPCDDEERAGDIKGALIIELRVERRGFTRWRPRWRPRR
jgi:hypothetical protein